MARRAKQLADDGSKVALQLRFDREVHDGIKDIAERAGISVNQLIQGMTRWAVAHAHVGEPCWTQDEFGDTLESRPQPGCVWFGRIGDSPRYPDDEQVGPIPSVAFALDFTERRVIRDDTDQPNRKPKRAKP